MRLSSLASILLAISSHTAAGNVPCATPPNQPALRYTISPRFIWFPSAANAEEVIGLFIKSNPSFAETAKSPVSATAQGTLQNFLNSPCTVNLTIEATAPTTPFQTLSLLNYTMSSADLICRLATHKLGRVYTELPHTMLSSHLRAEITGGQGPKRLRRGATMGEAAEGEAGEPRIASVEYSISCPNSAVGPVLSGEQAVESLEGLKGLAQVKDCDWCKKAKGELEGMCKPAGAPIQSLSDFVAERHWAYGGAVCEGCS